MLFDETRLNEPQSTTKESLFDIGKALGMQSLHRQALSER